MDDTLVTSTLKKVCVEGIQLLTDEFSFGPGRYKSSTGSSSEDDEDDDDDGMAPRRDGSEPLPVACLTGRQELVIRFSETNQFGLPRSLEEVELNLGGVCLHMFPHQVEPALLYYSRLFF